MRASVRTALIGAAQVLVWASVPVLLVQGRRVRGETPRLPEARDAVGTAPGKGAAAPEGPLGLLVLGDSTAAGVGVEFHSEGIAGRLGAELAARTGREVLWRADGRSGRTAADVLRGLALTSAERPDVVLVLVGVNDVLRLTPVRSFARSIAGILAGLREGCGPDTVLLLGAVPDMGAFPALPRPLRTLLGLRAGALDLAAARVAAAVPGAVHVPMPPLPADAAESYYAADRFHPGARAYALWAAELAPRCAVGGSGAR